MHLQWDKLSVPKPERSCGALLHPRKPSQQLVEGSPRASPACPLQPYGLILQDAGAPALHSGYVLGSGVTFRAALAVSAGVQHPPCPASLSGLVCHPPAPGWELLTCFSAQPCHVPSEMGLLI